MLTACGIKNNIKNTYLMTHLIIDVRDEKKMRKIVGKWNWDSILMDCIFIMLKLSNRVMCLFILDYFLIEVNTFDRIFFSCKRKIFIKLSSHTYVTWVYTLSRPVNNNNYVIFYYLWNIKNNSIFNKTKKKINSSGSGVEIYSLNHVTCLTYYQRISIIRRSSQRSMLPARLSLVLI